MGRRYDPRTWNARRAFGLPMVSNQHRMSIIKSVQTGTVTLNGNGNPNTATITLATPVDQLNSIIEYEWFTANAGNASNVGLWYPATFEWASATQITAKNCSTYNPASDTYIDTVHGWRVLEYVPGVIRSIQTGVKAMGNTLTSDTVTLSRAVNPLKCSVQIQGQWCNTQYLDSWTRIELTNSTTVTFTRYATSGNLVNNIGWRVVEYW